MDQIRPDYGTGSLADVLPAVLAYLGVPGMADPLGLSARLAGVRRIALLLVDGLGLELLPLAAPVAPRLAMVPVGDLIPLTAGFPSTTPTSLVSLGTGATPGQHGILGFTLNVPGTDRVLTHIDWWDDPDPSQWQPVTTLFTRAAAAGVAVAAVARPNFAGSGLTIAAYRGAAYHGASDMDGLVDEMLDVLSTSTPPTVVYGYHPTLDTVGHLRGVASEEWFAAVSEVDSLVARLAAGLPADAALLVTADHGMLNVPGGHRFDIDTDPRLARGVRVMAGEPRVRYLHTLPGASTDVLAAWRDVLGDAAWVAWRDEVIDGGWFGPVAPQHRDRIGDVVAVCRDSYAVVATKRERPTTARLIAYHGSFTAAEMRIPLFVLRGGSVGGDH